MKAYYSGTSRIYYKYGTTPDVYKSGSPTISDGIASGFSGSNYFLTKNSFPKDCTSYEILLKFKTSTPKSEEIICGSPYTGSNAAYYVPQLRKLSSGKLRWYGPKSYATDSTTVLSANTWYWVKLLWNGTQKQLSLSTDGENFTLEGTVNNTNTMYGIYQVEIGRGGGEGSMVAASSVTIDLTKSYIKINGNEWWRGTLPVESTSSDYDFYQDIENFKVYTSNDICKAFRN